MQVCASSHGVNLSKVRLPARRIVRRLPFVRVTRRPSLRLPQVAYQVEDSRGTGKGGMWQTKPLRKMPNPPLGQILQKRGHIARHSLPQFFWGLVQPASHAPLGFSHNEQAKCELFHNMRCWVAAD
jgi:hypothetical protein